MKLKKFIMVKVPTRDGGFSTRICLESIIEYRQSKLDSNETVIYTSRKDSTGETYYFIGLIKVEELDKIFNVK